MAGTDFDVIVAGVKARLHRSEDAPGFRERTVRAEINQQLISQQQQAAQAQRSRPDGASLYQTDWSGGQRWWKPLLSGEDINSYFISNRFDLWSEPGKIVPHNEIVEVSGADNVDNWFTIGEKLYGVNKDSLTEDGTHYDLAVWDPTPSPGDWDLVSGVHTTVDSGETVLAITYDQSDQFVYVATNDGEINRFNLAGTENAAWITGENINRYGCTMFVHQGEVWVWNGDTLRTINKSGPSLTARYDDGLGPELIGDYNTRQSPLAIASPEGIYYVKNVQQNNTYYAYVFRVDRDASGTYVGNPVATLPPGTIAIGITYHMGAVIIATSSDTIRVVPFSAPDHTLITFYYITSQAMGALGSIKGGTGSALSCGVWRFDAALGPYLFISGDQFVFVYDAVRGGIHPFLNVVPESFNQVAVTEVVGTPGMGLLYNGGSSGEYRHIELNMGFEGDPVTVSAFGDDETTYALESNYFDGGLPMEEKLISKVEIMFDPGTESGGAPLNEWTVQISADDGAWTDVIDSTSAGYNTLKGYAIGGGQISGKRFRYKLIYQTKNDDKLGLRALLVTLTTGEMVREWDLTLDGSELMNVDNQPVSPRAFLDDMRTVLATEGITTFINNFEDIDQDVSTDSTPTNVKVQAAEIMKKNPGESVIRLTLREDPYYAANAPA